MTKLPRHGGRRSLVASARAHPVRSVLITLAILLVTASPLLSVSVSPMAVYLDNHHRSGEMTLINPGTRPEEIRIDFAFGYPQSDSLGNVTVPVVPAAPPGEPSAVGWLTVFPRRIILQPGQRQVVRVLARPPANLPDGEYWARALIHSRGGQPPIEGRAGEVGVQIDVETVIIVAVNYRNGTVKTGLTADNAHASIVGDSAIAFIDLHRTGNAAFLGRILVEALDAGGHVLGGTERVLAVYHSMRRRVAVAIPAGATPVKIRYTMDTKRPDLPPGGPLPGTPVVVEVPLP
jgi:hypothetical protein